MEGKVPSRTGTGGGDEMSILTSRNRGGRHRKEGHRQNEGIEEDMGKLLDERNGQAKKKKGNRVSSAK